ncbi:LutC/YkgG family protein [Rudanella lutea]|uniref:LutC/YkgG family protein n=1 Tax=Rudanella lutea TaxID=451374 RepID=UPI000368F8CB|nr:LUD domain-containing protein [Rudanella lutea]
MSPRDKILQAVRQNKPALTALPAIPASNTFADRVVERFTEILTTIGGQVVPVPDLNGVAAYIRSHYPAHRVITTLPELAEVAEVQWQDTSPHQLADVEFAVLNVHFGVAENGAVWITDPLMMHRASPFICQHLGVVLSAGQIVPTMHEAYARIGSADYGFGLFIAGPSKTADIEQSLVLGAHGPKTMTVFLVD